MDSVGITAVSGIAVGHYTDTAGGTGCTVVLCENGAVGGVDVRGSAPGTRETDLLRPTTLVTEVHAILLGGGSAFGLDAASGVMRYLEQKGVGLKLGRVTIPIVPAAILFDLGVISGKARPGPDEGRLACEASSTKPAEEGSVGAGTGATVAKLVGLKRAVKGGIGTASIDLDDGVTVGAIVAVNAIGGVYDPDTGEIVAGPRGVDGGTMHDSMALLLSSGFKRSRGVPLANTTIGVVATNASLSKEQANKLASVAHDGMALAVRPAHTTSDGDTIFALATGTAHDPADLDKLCAAAVLCVSNAIVRGVRKAESLGGIPSVGELSRNVC